MSTNNFNSNTEGNPIEDQHQSDYNNIESIESIYTEETINIIDCVNAKNINLAFDHNAAGIGAANDELAYADVYSFNSARRAKHDRSLERRASKSQITDRRSDARFTASGEQQVDRREENLAANINAIRHACSKASKNSSE